MIGLIEYKKQLSGICLLILGVGLIVGCAPAGGNKTGHEYMMDMGHSVAFEANVVNDFYYNRWNPEEYYKLSQPRNPVKGTIPRGYVGLSNYSNGEVPANVSQLFETSDPDGSVPYYYTNTDEDRTRAMNEIKLNPYPITKERLAKGKELYNIYCGICHGEKGDGSGYLVRDDGKYPAQPANFLSDEFIAASNGRYYHTIMYGRNVMSSYKDKLNYEERWEVIQYIRSMQAASKSLKYDETANTFNTTDRIASRSASTSNDAGQASGETKVIHVGTTVDSTVIQHN